MPQGVKKSYSYQLFTEHITGVSGRGLILASNTFLTHKKRKRKFKLKQYVVWQHCMGFMQLLTNLASMRRKLHIVSIKDRFNANDIHFCFN